MCFVNLFETGMNLMNFVVRNQGSCMNLDLIVALEIEFSRSNRFKLLGFIGFICECSYFIM